MLQRARQARRRQRASRRRAPGARLALRVALALRRAQPRALAVAPALQRVRPLALRQGPPVPVRLRALLRLLLQRGLRALLLLQKGLLLLLLQRVLMALAAVGPVPWALGHPWPPQARPRALHRARRRRRLRARGCCILTSCPSGRWDVRAPICAKWAPGRRLLPLLP